MGYYYKKESFPDKAGHLEHMELYSRFEKPTSWQVCDYPVH